MEINSQQKTILYKAKVIKLTLLVLIIIPQLIFASITHNVVAGINIAFLVIAGFIFSKRHRINQPDWIQLLLKSNANLPANRLSLLHFFSHAISFIALVVYFLMLVGYIPFNHFLAEMMGILLFLGCALIFNIIYLQLNK